MNYDIIVNMAMAIIFFFISSIYGQIDVKNPDYKAYKHIICSTCIIMGLGNIFQIVFELIK